MPGPNFATLLEQSKQLTAHLGDTQDFLLQRNVEQLGDTSRRLHAKYGATTDLMSKTKAQQLLATKGFDADQLAKALTQIDLKSTFGTEFYCY